MNILQISTSDVGGGAEGSAYNLFRYYREAGYGSCLAVGTRHRSEEGIIEIPREHAPGPLHHLCFSMANFLRRHEDLFSGARRLARCFDRMANPARLKAWYNGFEEFDYPGCRKLIDNLPFRPDIIHCHNLH